MNAAERDGDRKLGMDALHLLAQVHLRRGNLEKATSACKVAMSGRKKLEGKGQSYHESLSLMAYICDQRGDAIDATTYRKLLPEGFEHPVYSGPVSEMQALSPVSSVPGTRDLLKSASAPTEISQDTSWLTEKLEPIPFTLTLKEQTSALETMEHHGHRKVTSLRFSPTRALSWAAGQGYLDVVKLMLKGGPPFPVTKPGLFTDSKKIQFSPAGVDGLEISRLGLSSVKPPLWAAAANGHETIVQLLIEKGAHINRPYASSENPIDTVGIPRLHNVSSSGPETSPLEIASKMEHSAVVRVLIQKGANVNAVSKHGVSCLHWAVSAGSCDVVRILVQAGANAHLEGTYGRNAFHVAVAAGKRQVAEFLLEQDGTLVKARTKQGCTALILAALNGRSELVDWLVSNGSDMNAIDDDGDTALDCAILLRKESTYGPLIANGAIVTSALIKAASSDKDESPLEALLEAGADPNVADSDSKTPLYWASYKGHLGRVKVLLRHGADVDAPSVSGTSPLGIAAELGHGKIVKALLEAGANGKNKNTSASDATP